MIIQLNFNWYQKEDGEDYYFAVVGKQFGTIVESPVVISIEEHQAAGEGDKWYYDIHLSDGTKQRIFNPNLVYYDGDTQ